MANTGTTLAKGKVIWDLVSDMVRGDSTANDEIDKIHTCFVLKNQYLISSRIYKNIEGHDSCNSFSLRVGIFLRVGGYFSHIAFPSIVLIKVKKCGIMSIFFYTHSTFTLQTLPFRQ